MPLIYDIAATGAVLLGSPYLFWRSMRYPEEMRERFAGCSKEGLDPPVWWHASSVGELEALRPILRETWNKAQGGKRPLLTLLTPTGRARALQLWGDRIDIRMVPLDWFPVVRRHFNQVRPKSLILIETEIWPAMISAAHKREIPVAVVNGRLSRRNIDKYRSMGWFFSPLFKRLRCVAARSPEDAELFRLMGVSAERICVAGNTKYEMPERPPSDPSWLEVRDWNAILVLGSLRSEEKETIKELLIHLKKKLPESQRVLVILAPRHPERAPLFANLAGDAGWIVERRSEVKQKVRPAENGAKILLLDTIGELSDLWWIAAAGLVGGTFAPLGGHNLFEPASRGCPTFFGPSTDTVADVAAVLGETGGGRSVSSGTALGEEFLELLKKDDLRRETAQRAGLAAQKLAGGVLKTLDWLDRWGVMTS